jgi:hypothetical protein
MNKINQELLVLNKKNAGIAKTQSRLNRRLTDINNYNSINKLDPKPNTVAIYKIKITVSAK